MEVDVGLGRDLVCNGGRDGNGGLVKGCGEDDALVVLRAASAFDCPAAARLLGKNRGHLADIRKARVRAMGESNLLQCPSIRSLLSG